MTTDTDEDIKYLLIPSLEVWEEGVAFCIPVFLFELTQCFAQVIASVSSASVADVDKAVAAAKEAFENGEWGRMNARERGRLMYRYVQDSLHLFHFLKSCFVSLKNCCIHFLKVMDVHNSTVRGSRLAIFSPPD